jgi:SagB-type dehydrogenase family enzyme
VNIASRIEPLADPEGICVSEQVFDQIRNKLDYPLARAEHTGLKGINVPLTVYKVVLPWEKEEATGSATQARATSDDRQKPLIPQSGFEFRSETTAKVFDRLVDSFIEDYMVKKYFVERSGWRTLAEVAKDSHLSTSSVYGSHSKIGPVLEEALQRGLIETRFFPGERGRGGEVMRVRVAFEKDVIKEYVNQKIKLGKNASSLPIFVAGTKVVSESTPIFGKEKIAVLPLLNISPDPADEYFADGLTEELITILSQIQGLRVISRTSINRNASLEIRDLSTILRYVFGCEAYFRVGPGIYGLRKTSPSGGALHPIEAYPLVVNVRGLERGLYHYNVGNHSLELLSEKSEKAARRLANDFSLGQVFPETSSVLFILTARFYRNFWKYRNHPRAYSVLLLDAGHLSQTFYLVCTALKLGAFFTAAINSVKMEQELGVDGWKEGAIGMCGCGIPSNQSFGLEPKFSSYEPRRKQAPALESLIGG